MQAHPMLSCAHQPHILLCLLKHTHTHTHTPHAHSARYQTQCRSRLVMPQANSCPHGNALQRRAFSPSYGCGALRLAGGMLPSVNHPCGHAQQVILGRIADVQVLAVSLRAGARSLRATSTCSSFPFLRGSCRPTQPTNVHASVTPMGRLPAGAVGSALGSEAPWMHASTCRRFSTLRAASFSCSSVRSCMDISAPEGHRHALGG